MNAFHMVADVNIKLAGFICDVTQNNLVVLVVGHRVRFGMGWCQLGSSEHKCYFSLAGVVDNS